MKSLKENLLRNIGVGKTKLIEDWLAENVELEGSYTIDKNFLINVKGHVTIDPDYQGEMPEYIQFGEVTEEFACRCKGLTSLRGCPSACYNFSCSGASVKNLKGCPVKVKNNFICEFCKMLEVLDGAPENIENSFYCNNCEKLKSLIGSPKVVKNTFCCDACKSLKSLEGVPASVGKYFIARYCGTQFTEEYVRKVCPNVQKVMV